MNEQQQLTYLEKGPLLIVRDDRCAYGIRYNFTQDNNGSVVRPIPNSARLHIRLGPCLVEDLGINHPDIWKCLHYYGESWIAFYHEQLSHTYHYILRDCQCLLFIMCAQGLDHAILLQDRYAEQGREISIWQRLFPDE